MIFAGNTGGSTILAGGDHGEDDRQQRYCRGQTRGEARRARFRQQTLRTQIRLTPISRCDQCYLEPLFGWCSNYHGAQKGKASEGEPREPEDSRVDVPLSSCSVCVCERDFFLPLFCALFRFPKVPGAPLAVVENSFREDGARWVSSISIKLRVCSKLMHASRGALLELFERRRGNFEL